MIRLGGPACGPDDPDAAALTVMTKILVGGAPVTQDYCDKIGADFYSPDPQGAIRNNFV